MAYRVEVKGLGSWTHGLKVYRKGIHVVDDEDVVEASKRISRGFANGEEFGVFVTNTDEPVTGPSKTYHDYPIGAKSGVTEPPGETFKLGDTHGAVEVEPGVFEPVAKIGRRQKTVTPAE